MLAHAPEREGVPAETVGVEPERLRPRIRAFDPLFAAARIAPRPLLLVHGALETSCRSPPIERSRTRSCHNDADAPGACLFVTHAGGHAAPPEVDEAAWNWLFSRVRAARQRPVPRAG